MSKIRIAIVILAGLLLTTSLFAQATRTWVSGVGDDVNPCSRTAPCKTFAGAISKTAPNGEISVLDPGGFGQVTITKGMRIDGHSFVASVLGTSGSAIVINTNQNVELSHIQINGAGLGTNAVNVVQAARVTIDNCDLVNYTGSGVTIGTTTPTKVEVVNTNITNTGSNGVNSSGTAGQEIDLQVDHCLITGAGIAFHTGTSTVGTISNSTLSHNSIGVQADAGSIALVNGNTISTNPTAALQSSANSSVIRISGNFIQQNGAGYNVTAPSQIFTAGNNSIQQTGNTGTLQAMGGLQ